MENKKTYTEEEVKLVLIKFWMWSTTHTTKENLINWFNNIKK